ncbi:MULTISPECIES: hypothetical protein [unclassified Mesorhizobium]|uniref:hypothetical protein n=1 Tax=unclassified Mesorhizobium TaxID=325217 RepID=UPI00112CB944|nr:MULTISPECIES: hypothetical protein [unclassified Mesorhizobium]MBZ9916883.1 hypothetical protein [Mesorhizobium sp. BR1-1-7]TPM85953.1 hypothetical protein FJ963_11125 [Mesorhizobium sp. B2-1-4]
MTRTSSRSGAIVYAGGAAAMRRAEDRNGVSGKKVVIGIKRRDRIISAFDWTALRRASRRD